MNNFLSGIFVGIILMIVSITVVLLFWGVVPATNFLETRGYTIIPPVPKLLITNVSLANSGKVVITDSDKKYLTPGSEGFIKVTVKNEGGKAENVRVNFRFLDPNDEDAVNHCLPALQKSRPGEILEAPGDLRFVNPLVALKELDNGERDFWGKIKVGGGSSRYVCVEVQLNLRDDESGEYEEQTSKHFVLPIHRL